MITDISQLDPNSTYTYADYLKWQFDESVELIKGKIYRMSPAPRRAHQRSVTSLLIDIGGFLNDNICQIYTAPFDIRLPVRNERKPDQLHTVVQPDICVICDTEKLDDAGCLGAPDWVIEITSPRTVKNDFNEKFNLYEELGVREYWIVQPKEKPYTCTCWKRESTRWSMCTKGVRFPAVFFPICLLLTTVFSTKCSPPTTRSPLLRST